MKTATHAAGRLLPAILFLTGLVSAQGTSIPPGTINSGHWTKKGSPYTVQGNLTVNGLKIDPGVEIRVVAGAQLLVSGALVAKGTARDPILFTEAVAAKGWQGIFLNNSWKQTVLKYCIVERSQRSGIRIYNNTGTTPTLQNCTIRNNSSTSNGGGVQATIANGTLTLTDCRILNNVSDPGANNRNNGGGGIAVTGSVVLDNCHIIGNKCSSYSVGGKYAYAYCYGGGVYIDGNARLLNCSISENNAHVYARATDRWLKWGHMYALGGGVYLKSGKTTVTNSVISRNSTSDADPGHGIRARVHYDGLYVESGTVSIMNSTIARNKASRAALTHAGIHINKATVTLRNSIVYHNDWRGGTNYGPQVTFVTAPKVDYCCIYNNPFTKTGTGNISLNPGFQKDCEMIAWNMFNPCIDAGDPKSIYNDTHYPHGNRYYFGPALGTKRNDIGAHGGPGAANWLRPVSVKLEVTPARKPLPKNLAFKLTGGDPRVFGLILVSLVDSSNKVLVGPLDLLLFDHFCPDRSTGLSLPVPQGITFLPKTRLMFQSFVIDNDLRVFAAPPVFW